LGKTQNTCGKNSKHLLGVKLTLYQALKTLAKKKDVPYQSLMKIFLAEKIKQEMAEVK
jgi:hypothetical protein